MNSNGENGSLCKPTYSNLKLLQVSSPIPLNNYSGSTLKCPANNVLNVRMGVCCTRLRSDKISNYNQRYDPVKKSIQNLLFLGNSGSGKSTLFYATKAPQWVSIGKDMIPTTSFHYEKINYNDTILGMFDMSGMESMQFLWSNMYYMIYFKVIFFMVSLMEENHENSKLWIRRLLNEHMLRETTIIVLINIFSQTDEEARRFIPATVAKLGLNELSNLRTSSTRFMWYIINATNGIYDENWSTILTSITKTNE